MWVCWVMMTVLVAALLWVLATERRGEWILKPAASATFIATALVAGGLGTTVGRILVVGLVLAAVGDVLLIPKRKATFLAGLVAFLLGHVAYAVAFVVRGVDVPAAAGAAAVLAVAAAPILRWLWPHVERPMRMPVIAYIAVITAMVAAGAGTARQGGAWLLLLGAFAFYLSDIAVARERFVKRGFVNRAWGLPLYFFAQMVLASQAGAMA